MNDKQKQVVTSSPALADRSDWYPEHWKGLVPARVGMIRTVRSEMPFGIGTQHAAMEGEEYPVWVNRHGAVSAVFPDGSRLGLKPVEFVVVEFHPGGRAT